MKQGLTKQILAAGLMGSLAFGATQALASPYFSYDPSGAGAGGFTANSASGTSSEHLFVTGANTFAGAGWVKITSLNDNSSAIAGTAYEVTGLYATFTLGVTYIPIPGPGFGGFGQPNSFYTVNSFSFQLFRDTGFDNGFTQANAAGAGQMAVVSNTAGDVLLGGGTLILPGNASVANNNGTSLNVSTDFVLNGAIGAGYFYDPVPFYDLALAAFSSTGGAWLFNPNTGMASVGNASGVVDFSKVPEPGTLALLGVALLGLGFTARRTKQ